MRRKELKMTLSELASMSDISESYLSKIENSISTNVKTYILDNIKDALDLAERVNLTSRKNKTALSHGADNGLESMLENLSRLLRSYNRKGEITLNETIDILSRIEKIVHHK